MRLRVRDWGNDEKKDIGAGTVHLPACAPGRRPGVGPRREHGDGTNNTPSPTAYTQLTFTASAHLAVRITRSKGKRIGCDLRQVLDAVFTKISAK